MVLKSKKCVGKCYVLKDIEMHIDFKMHKYIYK